MGRATNCKADKKLQRQLAALNEPSKRRLWWPTIFLAIAIIVAIKTISANSELQALPKTTTTSHASQPADTNPARHPIYIDALGRRPQMTKPVDQSEPKHDFYVSLLSRLLYLINNHPRTEINTDMYNQLLEGVLGWDLRPTDGFLGISYEISPTKIRKALCANPRFLQRPIDERQEQEYWVSLSHENRHLEQLEDPETYFSGDPCQAKLLREVEAYRAECDMAFELNYLDANQGKCPLILEGDGSEFDRWVAREIQVGVARDPELKHCMPYFASCYTQDCL